MCVFYNKYDFLNIKFPISIKSLKIYDLNVLTIFHPIYVTLST